MSYLVLARKWRPQSFDDLVGQEHVSRTIGNAIAQERVAHAFLFTGVRGVGKTTSARILAKTLNCEKGPTATPCLVCSPCKEIAAGVDVDVQEIDGASNTGVDDVRRIQESLPYRPARDRYKILIVDEVHMLSGNAWNAFLKTLEEPPPHVKFIFATTEVHKVPITILSRCQRYDFKMISAQRIAERVRYILGEEKITADDAAVQLVAREAAGSMRDALSILDQVIAFGGNKLVGEEVARVLGVADRQALHGLASAIVAADAAQALREIDRLASAGFDLAHVARDLLRRFRDLVIARLVPEPDALLDLADAELADVKTLAANADADDLSRLFQGMSRGLDEIAKSGTPRHAFEVATVRLARRPPLVPVDALLDRLAALEKRLGGGTAGGGGGGNRPSAAGGQRPGGASGGGMRAEADVPTPRPQAQPQAHPQSQPHPQPQPQPQATFVTPSPRSPMPTVQASSHGSPSASISSPPTFASAAPPTNTATATATARAVSPEPTNGSEIVVAVSEVVVQPEIIFEGGTPERIRVVVGRLRAQRATWGSLIEHGVVVRCDAGGFEIAYEKRSFLAAQVTDRGFGEALVKAAREELGASARVLVCETAPKGRSLAGLATQQKNAALDQARKAALANAAVLDAVAIFSAEVRGVRLPGEDH